MGHLPCINSLLTNCAQTTINVSFNHWKRCCGLCNFHICHKTWQILCHSKNQTAAANGRSNLHSSTDFSLTKLISKKTATNLISPKFTNAIYVQLMTLMAPFLVALFNTLLMKEDLPPRTVPAMLSAFVGALLMLFSNIFPFKFAITPLDFVGIALAFVSACFLGITTYFCLMLIR